MASEVRISLCLHKVTSKWRKLKAEQPWPLREYVICYRACQRELILTEKHRDIKYFQAAFVPRNETEEPRFLCIAFKAAMQDSEGYAPYRPFAGILRPLLIAPNGTWSSGCVVDWTVLQLSQ